MSKVQQSIVLAGFTIAIASIFLLILGNNAFAVKFDNYTSETYKIQFEYPKNWTVTEKTSRYDEGSAIDVRSNSSTARFGLDYKDAISFLGTSDIQEATKNLISITKKSLARFDLRVIEEPQLITIDNKTAGSVVSVLEEKFDDDPVRLANQMWIVIIDSNAYILTYVDKPNNFDSPENIEIRDNLIKSIKFLENPEPQQKSRFD